MKKPQISSDTAPQVEPQPRPVCSSCNFRDPVGGVEEHTLCQLCFEGMTVCGMDAYARFMAYGFNRIRRDILSGHES